MTIQLNYDFHYVIIKKVDQNVGHLSVRNLLNEFFKQILTRGFYQTINTINFTYIFCLYENKKVKCVENAYFVLHVKTDCCKQNYTEYVSIET